MKTPKKILIVDKLSGEALDILTSAPDFEVEQVHGAEKSAKMAAAKNAHGILVRSGTKIDSEFLQACDELEMVVRAGVGVDNIDIEEATRRGVVVENVPEGNIRSAAEHSISMLLALCRNIPQAYKTMKEGGWDRSKYVGTEFLGKTLGIIGLGKIGRMVQQMSCCLGMKTIAYDPFISEQMATEIGIHLEKDINKLVASVDFLTLHVPMSQETRDLISASVLENARPGLLLVNCARGGVVNEPDLLAAIDDGKVARAAIDVYKEEPPGLTDLVKHPKVITTPHLGASTQEAQQNVATGAAQQLIDYFQKGKLTSPINAVVLEPDLVADFLPYRELAFSLGLIHSQILEGNPAKIRVRFIGDSLESEIQRYLTSAVLCGFLKDRSAQPVNAISAHHMAAEMGVIVEEVSEGRSRYFHRMIKIEVTDSAGQRELGGTIRGQRGLRLVSLDDYQFDAVLEGELLLVKNEDRPGMIGVIGNYLAGKNVNISYMSLGRDTSGGTAMALLNLDEPVPDSVAGELESHDGVLWSRLAHLPSPD